MERGYHALLVSFQKEMGVVANQWRLLQPRECAKVQNLHRRLYVGHLRASADFAGEERRVEEVRAHSANLRMKSGYGEHDLRDQIDHLLRSVQRTQAKGGRQ